LGNNVTASLKATLGVPVLSGHVLNIKMWKSIFGVWTDIPCVDGAGSCTYNDLCQFLEQNVEPQCPEILSQYNISCECPYQIGNYGFPPLNIPTINPGFSWLTSGDFSIQGQVVDDSGNEVACVLAYFSLGDSILKEINH